MIVAGVIFVHVATEGIADLPIARRLLAEAGLAEGRAFVCNGKAALDGRLADYNRAAGFGPWFVLRDLDRDAPCAPALIARLLPHPADAMCLRIAVRKAEAWLLADVEGLARFLAVSKQAVPSRPDEIEDPKAVLVALARRSRKRAIREDVVPLAGTSAQVGPGYVDRLREFCTEHWSPARARAASPSLDGALAALHRLTRR